MPVEPIGIKWMVSTEDGLFKGLYACKGEAEKEDAKLRGVEAPDEAEKGEEVGPEGEGKAEGDKEPIDAFEPEPEEPEAEAKPKTFPCPSCTFVAKSQGGLSAHTRLKHPAPVVEADDGPGF